MSVDVGKVGNILINGLNFAFPQTKPAQPMNKKHATLFALTPLVLGFPLMAQDEAPEELEAFVAEQTVTDPIGFIPDMEVTSAFGGLDISLVETPRSIDRVSAEMIDQFGIDSLNDLITFSSGTFSSSFFGIEGSLNIRGSTAETFFRGIKRIENPGTFPTPIAAAQSVDIVKGPADPYMGPSKLGGYLNFIPKSARASTGKYLDETTGNVTVTFGSYDKAQGEFEIGGPLTLGERQAGYYLYGLLEDSDSFYDNNFNRNKIIQGSLDVQLNDAWRLETGGMYHNWEGTENAGWNRVTQELIDDGTYQRGLASDIDLDGDGFVSGDEFIATGVPFSFATVFAPEGTFFPAGALDPSLALDPDTLIDTDNDGIGDTARTATLEPNQVLIGDDDIADSDNFLVYFDVVNDSNPDFRFKNQLFIEYLDRYKFASYGFSQAMEVFLIEQRAQFNIKRDLSEAVEMDAVLSGGVRYYDADYFSDFDFEFFDRRDLITGETPRDRVLTSVQNSARTPWSQQYNTTIFQPSFSAMANFTVFERLNLLVGGRGDHFDVEIDNFAPGADSPTGDDFEWSWTGSISYEVVDSVHPYVTFSRQNTINTDQAGGIDPGNVAGDSLLNTQELFELGLKAELLERKLFATFAFYDQKTSSFSSQAEQNQAINARGYELSLRYVPNKNWSFSFAGNWQKSTYDPLTGDNATFNFLNSADTNFPGELIYGGTVGGSVLASEDYEERSGVPDKNLSFVTTYFNDAGWGVNFAAKFIPEVAANRTKTITLPEAYLFDLGGFYENDNWRVSFIVKNLTDEQWFRSNFPELFGGVVVLPQLPRTYEATVTYKF